MITHQFTASAENARQRLDQFLVNELPELSRARIQALMREGLVTVNGQHCTPSDKVRAGDAISLSEPPPVPVETVAENIPLNLLHEDDDLLVINKSPGMVVHPAPGNYTGTLVNALLHHCDELSGIGGEERPGIIHRLDKDTSGCLVVAKNDTAHHSLSAQFAGREVTKIYLALAYGMPRKKNGSIHAPIGRHPFNRQMMTIRNRDGREAHTDWTVRGALTGGAIIECHLHTGRTHQIRVHLKHLGHPLLGDAIYGKKLNFPRQMLHAWKLGFTHPRTGQRLDFLSPIPADFIQAGVPADLA